MKTILVIYTNVRKGIEQIKTSKKYSFNTESDVKVGDMIESSAYDTKMQVVKILDESFKYYNSVNGEMSDKFNSSLQWEIRELNVQHKEKKESAVINAFWVEEEKEN